MEQFSISLTLGKASDPHGANLAHNNRSFAAANIDPARTPENIVFEKTHVLFAYESLFSEALEAYNAKQKKPCRRIHDYYTHIANGKREEPFYEIVVQFGDCKTAPCGSPRGEIAKEMLIEYMQAFQRRNPNLHVFNAVLHMDEASPHLHIDFVPFYTKGRKNGLSKGVSMRAALEEMGFESRGRYDSPAMGWEASERIAMEQILMRHGYKREDKNAHYAHMTVAEYKRTQDARRAAEHLRRQRKYESSAVTAARSLNLRIAELSAAMQDMKRERMSPYKSFFYTDRDKQAYVQEEIERVHIPFRQTENGFEAQQCFADTIRRIEQSYKAKPVSAREKLRTEIDRQLPSSKDLDELLARIQDAGYLIKRGKYLAFRPIDGERYIRLRSLGAEYSENALRDRIKVNQEYEHRLDEQLRAAKQNGKENVRTLFMMRSYTIAVKRGMITPRKRNPNQKLTWVNDAELDRLLMLNSMINEGATLDSIRRDFAEKEKAAKAQQAVYDKAKKDLQFAHDLREQLELLYAGKPSERFTRQQAEDYIRSMPSITPYNWQNVEHMVAEFTSQAEKAAADLNAAENELKQAAEILTLAERVYAGTHVQELSDRESEAHLSDYVENGIVPADSNTPTYRPLRR